MVPIHSGMPSALKESGFLPFAIWMNLGHKMVCGIIQTQANAA